MKFQFNPQRSDAPLAIYVSGETVIINGMAYDLSPLAEGQSISFGGGSAKRDNGITVSLPLPYQQHPSIDPMQVYTVDVAEDGPVAVPGHDSEQPAEVIEGVIEWPEPQPEYTPERVTMRQARLALHAAGLLPLVDAAIDNLEEPHKTAARIEWEYSQEVHRGKQIVQMLAPALGLSETDLDNLFIAAALL